MNDEQGDDHEYYEDCYVPARDNNKLKQKMEKLKYILDGYGNFAIFSDKNSYEDMARGFHFKPIRAGVCTIDIGYKMDKDGEEERIVNVHCFGESISLGLESREEDSEIINENI